MGGVCVQWDGWCVCSEMGGVCAVGWVVCGRWDGRCVCGGMGGVCVQWDVCGGMDGCVCSGMCGVCSGWCVQ